MIDVKLDRFLRIQTEGTIEILQNNVHYNRYEATPYDVLDEWFAVRPLKKSDHLVDFGCGKGRVPIYSAYRFGNSSTGIDVNGRLLQEAYANLNSFRTAHKKAGGHVDFEQKSAEVCDILTDQNVFYFFNPFSVEVFQTVVNRILQSLELTPRQAEIVLYYPTTAYVYFLEEQTSFTRSEEILIPVRSDQNDDERILIYRWDK